MVLTRSKSSSGKLVGSDCTSGSSETYAKLSLIASGSCDPPETSVRSEVSSGSPYLKREIPNPLDVLAQYKFNKLRISAEVEEKRGGKFKAKIKLSRIVGKSEDNHIIPVSFFLGCIVKIFDTSEDFFEAAQGLLNAFQKLGTHPYYNSVHKCYNKLKESKSGEEHLAFLLEAKYFLEERLIPFVFFVWNERFLSSFKEHRMPKEFSSEANVVKLAKEEILSLVDCCGTLEKFKENISLVREKCFMALDLPPIIRKGSVEVSPGFLRGILKEASNSLVKILKSGLIQQIETFAVSDELPSFLLSAEELLCSKLYGQEQVSMIERSYRESKANDKSQWMGFFTKFKSIYEFQQLVNKIDNRSALLEFKLCRMKLCELLPLHQDKSQIQKRSFVTDRAVILSILEVMSNEDKKDLLGVRRNIVLNVAYDAYELVNAWVTVLEIKHSSDYYKSRDYLQFIQKFLNISSFVRAFLISRSDLHSSLNEAKVLEAVDKSLIDEGDPDHSRLSTCVIPPSSSKASTSTCGDTDHIMDVVSKDLVSESQSLYNIFFTSSILKSIKYKTFKVSFCTIDELQSRETIRPVEMDDLLIIKRDSECGVTFESCIVNGRTYKLRESTSVSSLIKEILDVVDPVHPYTSLDEYVRGYYQSRIDEILQEGCKSESVEKRRSKFYGEDFFFEEPFIYLYVHHLLSLKEQTLKKIGENLVQKTYAELKYLWDGSPAIKDEAWYSEIKEEKEKEEKEEKDLSERIGLASLATTCGHSRFAKYLIGRFTELCTTTNSEGYRLSHVAAAYGCLDVLKAVVEKANHLQFKSENEVKNTALHSAAYGGAIKVVTFLIGKINEFNLKSYINEQNAFGETSLHLASSLGHSQVVQVLINAGADQKITNNGRNIPLHLAALTHRLEAFKILAQKNSSLMCKNYRGDTFLHIAASRNCLNLVEYFFLKQKKLFVELSKAKNNLGGIPLHTAAYYGSYEVVRFFVEKDEKLASDTDKYDNVPLHSAVRAESEGVCFSDYFVVVRFFIEKNANLANSFDKNGLTPLHNAASWGRYEMVKTFAEMEVDLNVQAKNNGNTSLHFAIFHEHLEVARLLIERGADPSLQNDYGNNALHAIARCVSNNELFLFIVEQSPWSIAVNNNYGFTPVYVATYNNLQLVKCLMERYKGLLGRRDPNGNTLLHLSAMYDNEGLPEFLITKGADPESVNRDGHTPLILSFHYNQKAFIGYALKSGKFKLESTDNYGRNILHLCVLLEDGELISHVYSAVEQKGVDFSKKLKGALDNHGYTSSNLEDLGKTWGDFCDERANIRSQPEPIFLFVESNLKRCSKNEASFSDIRSFDALLGKFESQRSVLINHILRSVIMSGPSTDLLYSIRCIIPELKNKQYSECMKHIEKILKFHSKFKEYEWYDGDYEWCYKVHSNEMRQESFVRPNIEQGLHSPSFKKDNVPFSDSQVTKIQTIEIQKSKTREDDNATPTAQKIRKQIRSILGNQEIEISDLITLEFATKNRYYNYWLQQIDIARAGRLHYRLTTKDGYVFEVANLAKDDGKKHIVEVLNQFKKNKKQQRLTLIITLNNTHWVTLVIKRQNGKYVSCYADSMAALVLDSITDIIQNNLGNNIRINNVSVSQQTDGWNCGLWALENASDINKVLEQDNNLGNQGRDVLGKIRNSLTLNVPGLDNIVDENNLRNEEYFKGLRIDISGELRDVNTDDGRARSDGADSVMSFFINNQNNHEIFRLLLEYLESLRPQLSHFNKEQQAALLQFVSSSFPNASIELVKQGLYLPSFEKRGVKINGKCTEITRGLSQASLLQSDKSFLSNLETSAKIYERIAQGRQISKREEREVFAFSTLLDSFKPKLGPATNSLSSSLIHNRGYKTFSDLSNYIAGIKGDFAIHLVTSNHVVAIYRIVDDYAYFDCNTAFVSGLKNVNQLMKIVEKATEFAGYEVGEKGFFVEHFDVERANKLLSSEGKQILAKEIKTERQLLAEQDKELGLIKINGREISRVQLYDFGTKINVEGSVPLLINADMNLNSKKFQDLLNKKGVIMTAREYLKNLKNSKNVEEVIQATKVIPFIGSKREIEEVEQTRRPKQSLLELAKGTINSILAAVFLTNASRLKSQLPGKTDNKPETYFNDPIANNQLQRSL